MDRHTFLTEYNISEEDLLAAEVSWEELALIAAEYQKLEETMRELGKSFIDEYLYDIEKAGIHSYRYRTKDVWHLLEKVIRKKKENPEKFFSNSELAKMANVSVKTAETKFKKTYNTTPSNYRKETM